MAEEYCPLRCAAMAMAVCTRLCWVGDLKRHGCNWCFLSPATGVLAPD